MKRAQAIADFKETLNSLRILHRMSEEICAAVYAVNEQTRAHCKKYGGNKFTIGLRRMKAATTCLKCDIGGEIQSCEWNIKQLIKSDPDLIAEGPKEGPHQFTGRHAMSAQQAWANEL
jgi:hypothetical protein